MQQPSKPQSVSHSHTGKIPIPKPPKPVIETPGPERSSLKKDQLEKALGDFQKQEEQAVHHEQSILSDKGKVLHVGKEEQGTIITDTKRDWSFARAVKGALGGWYKKKEKVVRESINKPEPEKNLVSSKTRADVIKKAAAKSSLPEKENFKHVKPKRPLTRGKRTHSSVRIKEKNVPKEIGDTKPRWTHVIEEEEKKEVKKTPTPKNETDSSEVASVKNPTRLLESPRRHRRLLERPEDRKPKKVVKTFRKASTATPVKISGIKFAAKPSESSVLLSKKQTQEPAKEESVQKVPKPDLEKAIAAEVKTLEESRSKPKPEPRPNPEPEIIETSTSPAPELVEEREMPEPVMAPNSEPETTRDPLQYQLEPKPEVEPIPIVTIVLVIIFIVALAISTTLLQSF